jgi:hypothetical protein
MKKRFAARLESVGPSGAWTYLTLPFDVETTFGTRARLAVKGTINDYPFQSSVFPDGKGRHTLMVNKAMQRGAKAAPPEKVQVVLEPDTIPRMVAVPRDLKKLLARNRQAGEFFTGLAPSHQKAYVEWIESAKKDETRQRRLEKSVALLAAGTKVR